MVGRVISRGFSDEHRDRHYMMVDGVDGRVHYVDVGRGDATPSVPEGATVRIEPTRAVASQADRTVDAVTRANGGCYSVDLHLRHDDNASEALVARDRKSVVEGQSVLVRVSHGGRRITTKQKK